MSSLSLIRNIPAVGNRNSSRGIPATATYAFNVFNSETVCGVVEAAFELDQPIYLQTSCSTVRAYSAARLCGMIEVFIPRSWRKNVCIHLDHCDDLTLIEECIDAGWDSVMIDASAYPLADNIARTLRVVKLAHERGVLVEGEIGTLDGEEDGFESDQRAARVTPSECKLFIEETGVDLAAIGVGNKHGHYAAGACDIDIELLAKVCRICPATALVLHGGSGIPWSQVAAAVTRGGVRKINISTELKDAYLQAMSRHLADEQNRYQVNRCVERAVAAVKEMAVDKLRFIRSLTASS